MRRSLWFIMFLSWNSSSGQKRVLHVDTIEVKRQEYGFILGLQPPEFVFDSVLFFPHKNQFAIYGYVKTFSNDIDSGLVYIDLISSDSLKANYTATKSYGKFELWVKPGDKYRFYGGIQDAYISIKNKKHLDSSKERK